MINRQKLIEELTDVIVKHACKPSGCEDCLCAFEYGTVEESCEEYLEYNKLAEKIYSEFVVKIIDQKPPADQWIPCSERLPDKDGEYLVWYECGEDEDDEKGIAIVPFWTDIEMFGVYQDIFDSQSLGFVDSEFYECETAKAWMPLPEPYKGEK